MNQEKIGKFISELRKDKNMTQLELSNKLGISDRTISKWENGRGMPDISLFDPLCKELNISINELLKGERIKSNKNETQITAEILTEYSKYLKKKERRKITSLLVVIVLFIFILFSIFILFFNKTFFGTMYNSDFISNVSIPIPRFSYYRGTGGMEEYTTKLKTLKQPDEINVFIDQYLSSLDIIKCNNETYYYNSRNDFTIIQYRANNDGIGFVNTIYISYTNGNICN